MTNSKETELKPCECRLCNDIEWGAGDIPQVVAAEVLPGGFSLKVKCTCCGTAGPTAKNAEEAVCLWDQLQNPNIIAQLLKEKGELIEGFGHCLRVASSLRAVIEELPIIDGAAHKRAAKFTDVWQEWLENNDAVIDLLARLSQPQEQPCGTCGGAGWVEGVGTEPGCCGGSSWECGAVGCSGPVATAVQTQEQCPHCDGQPFAPQSKDPSL